MYLVLQSNSIIHNISLYIVILSQYLIIILMQSSLISIITAYISLTGNISIEFYSLNYFHILLVLTDHLLLQLSCDYPISLLIYAYGDAIRYF